MNLANFWKYFPGQWHFERFISEESMLTGFLNVEKINPTFYKAHENGTYKHSNEQTFFRDYQFNWKNECLNISGFNPKDGYVLLHSISDASRTHTHICKQDVYEFELKEFGLNSWESAIVITGPKKNLIIKTNYNRE
jgi:hypothetical protein